MIIYLITVALFFLFMYLCYKHSETERLETETAQNILKDKYSVKLEYLYTRLEFNNQKNIILKEDFIVAPHYYKAIKPGTYATEAILQLANEIFSYLNICPVDVTVVYDWDEYQLYNQMSDYIKNGFDKMPSAEDFTKIQNLYAKIENGYFISQLHELKQIENNDATISELNSLLAKANKICTEIAEYNSIIGKY